MTPFEEHYAEIDPLLQSIAREVSRGYRAYGIEQPDMFQAAAMWCVDHPAKLTAWMDKDEEPYGDRKLARAIRNACIDEGENWKAQALGYSRDDLYYYSRAEVKELLSKAFDEEAWLHPDRPEAETEKRRKAVPSEGGNWVASLSDVSRGFSRLDGQDQEILRMFHDEPQWTNNEAAEFFGISKQTMSARHDAAVKRLVDHLGGPRPRNPHDADCEHEYRPWPAGRRAVSNSQAREIQSSYWESE